MSHPSKPDFPVTGTEGDLIRAAFVERGDVGYHHALSNLQIQMIAIGGAIGVGLFLGIGARLASAGPALVLSYLVVAAVVYLMMRALGEMVLYRPTTGAWVSYAREFVGDRFAHLTGWIYTVIAALAGVVELAAIGVYVQYWAPTIPGWVSSLLALLIIAGANMLSVKAFGSIELGAAGIKVLAILLFLATGVVVVILAAAGLLNSQASITNLWAQGGFFPQGLLAPVIVLSGVVFSFSAIEIVGISAGEAKDPAKTMPKAIRSVVLRIGLFYLGSIVVLSVLLPTTSYSGKESPFVTAMASLGVTGLGGVMNFVVLTAAISGVNATLYAAVRLLRNLAANDRAPRFTAKMSRRGVPVAALISIGSFYLLGTGLIYFAGAEAAFEIVLGSCAVFVVFGWVAILVSHIGFRRQVAAGRIPEPTFRMPGSPVTDWVCLVVLVIFALMIIFDFSNPHWWYGLVAAIALPGVILLSFEYFRRKNGPVPTQA